MPAKENAVEAIHPDVQNPFEIGMGRRVAGEDPAKREQILEGAKRVFMTQGFDLASMNDITREAGVSKGTIYVYFASKEDLFAALIERERNRVVETMKHALDEHEPIGEALQDFGVTLTLHVTSEPTIRAMRMVLAVIGRMPRLSEQFFSAESENGYTVLKAYFDRKVAENKLSLADTDLAARQFTELCMAGMFKRRLFGELPEPPSRAQVERTVSSAVRVMGAAYGPW